MVSKMYIFQFTAFAFFKLIVFSFYICFEKFTFFKFINSCFHICFKFITFCFHFFLFSFFHVIVSSDVFIFYFTVSSLLLLLPWVLGIWESIFFFSGVFYLTLLPAFIKTSLGPTVHPWRLQTFPTRFKTRTWSIFLFESYSVQQKVLLGSFYLFVRVCYKLL